MYILEQGNALIWSYLFKLITRESDMVTVILYKDIKWVQDAAEMVAKYMSVRSYLAGSSL